ncbi:MAG: hypothetical protein GY745_01995 [Actinomycetia bacterium]|nr:hypothetical protein [Actinomycetes bacterium]
MGGCPRVDSRGLIPVGVDAETGALLPFDPDEGGPFFAIAGPRRSGRSTALGAMGRWAAAAGWEVFCVPASKRSPLAGAGRAGNRVLILVDDAQHLDDSSMLEAVLATDAQISIAMAGPPTQASQGDAVGLGRLDSDWLTTPRPGCGVLGIADEPILARVPMGVAHDAHTWSLRPVAGI